MAPPANDPWVHRALETLGIDRFALIVFDSALPRDDAWDVGTGSPYSNLGRDVLALARTLGFNGIQLGPQGAVSRDFPSPYDGTAFSRNPLSIALETLEDALDAPGGPLLGADEVESVLRARPSDAERRVHHAFAYDAQSTLLATAAMHLARRATTTSGAPLLKRFRAWSQRNADWLVADGLYEVLCELNGVGDFERFRTDGERRHDRGLWRVDFRDAASPPGGATSATSILGRPLPPERRERVETLRRRHADALEQYAWIQFIAHEQHRVLHHWAAERGLELYGDLQVGHSRRDFWHFLGVFLEHYRLGAPPSRTNPEGQPWGQPVFDPELYLHGGQPGPVLRLLARRAEKLFAEYDRVRVDHPHGLVCPWVYRCNTPDDHAAVRSGARLFSSPDLDDHPELARHALVDASQIDRELPRHDDHSVRFVTPEQTSRFSACFDLLAGRAKARGGVDRLVCEVLSTQPTELQAVRRRHGLGRFRVTTKAKLDDATDVYRTENAEPEDWMLLGNHDTAPIWKLVEDWQRTGEAARQADYLATRLSPKGRDPAGFRRALAGDPSELAHAKLAELLTGRARNVLVSFSDLLGFVEPFNVPGSVSESNWAQRIGRNFRQEYGDLVAQGRALDVKRALRLALGAVAPESELLRGS